MGPIRRRLGLCATLTLLPAQALAEVCDKERPLWSPADGPMSALDELFHLATTLPGLGIAGALTLALLSGTRLYWALTALFSAIIALSLWAMQNDPLGLTQAAMAEGCVGPQTLTIATCTVICAFALTALVRLHLRPPL